MVAEQDFVTVDQAAQFLGVSRSTIWRWIDRGSLPAYRVGQRRVRLKRGELVHVITPARAEQEKGGVMRQGEREQLSRPLTEEEKQRALAALEAAKHFKARLLARRGGIPFSDSTELIHQAREERTEQLS